MSRRAFYKRFGGDFLMGTMDLSLEESGAYSKLLDLMYDRGKPIPDEPRWIAGFLNCSVRKWGQLRASLLAAPNKLILRGEYISNPRFEREIALDGESHGKAVEWGRMGGRTRAQRERAARDAERAQREPELFAGSQGGNGRIPPAQAKAPLPGGESSNSGENAPGSDINSGLSSAFDEFISSSHNRKSPESEAARPEINGLEQGSLKPARASHIPESRERDTSVSLSPPGAAKKPAAKSRKKAKAARALPKAWKPDPLTEEVAAIIAQWPEGKAALELGRFIDHAAQNGRTAKDWNAAWRNWIRKAEDDRNRANRSADGKRKGWGGIAGAR